MVDGIKFPANVIIIDTAFLNFVTADIKLFFEKKLNRALLPMNLQTLLTCMALDAGVDVGDNQIQTLWVYDKDSSNIYHSSPSDLKKNLDGMAFSNRIGEFLSMAVPCEELVSREALFLDLLSIVVDSAEVKRIVVLGDERAYGASLLKTLQTIKDKEVIQFGMDKPLTPVQHRWEVLGFPLLHALGIKSEEIQ